MCADIVTCILHVHISRWEVHHNYHRHIWSYIYTRIYTCIRADTRIKKILVDMVAVARSILNPKARLPRLWISNWNRGARHGMLSFHRQGIHLQGDHIRKKKILRYIEMSQWLGKGTSISLVGGWICFCRASSGFSAGAGRARAPMPGRVGFCFYF